MVNSKHFRMDQRLIADSLTSNRGNVRPPNLIKGTIRFSLPLQPPHYCRREKTFQNSP